MEVLDTKIGLAAIQVNQAKYLQELVQFQLQGIDSYLFDIKSAIDNSDTLVIAQHISSFKINADLLGADLIAHHCTSMSEALVNYNKDSFSQLYQTLQQAVEKTKTAISNYRKQTERI